MRYTPVLNILGILLAILAATMLPMMADIVTGSSNWQAFAISALATGFVGVGLFPHIITKLILILGYAKHFY